MRRQLSSAFTTFWKFIFPTIWLAGFASATLAMFMHADLNDSEGVSSKWMSLAITILGAAFLYWFLMRLKRVEIDDQFLYVSNYSREIKVPLRDIEEVRENRWINIHPISVLFYKETGFGQRITFMPRRHWAFWQAHPVVQELESAARGARGLPVEHPTPESRRS
jgi:hypothetical protein